MAADKDLWESCVLEEEDRSERRGQRCRRRVSFSVWKAQLRWSAGGSAEKRGSDLTQAGVSEGRLCAPVYHALKRGHAGPFEVPDHPAGSLKTRRRWTFMPLAESYSIFIHLLMCIFWGRDSKKHFFFLPHTAPEGKIINSPCFVISPFIVMF